MNERKFLIRNVKKARDLINGKLIIKPKDKSGDLVTNFDMAIEEFFIKKIKKTYPKFDIVSEEENSEKKLTKNCFVIDPIDGTNNFARKIPMWGIQIACIENGETIASVIYLPVYDELYSADKTGAYLNDEKIHVNRQNEKIGIYTIGGQLPESYEMQTKNPNYRHFGSACFTMAMVACGKTSAAFFRENIHPWDFIPGEYIVKQAGGVSFVKDHIKICANMTSWSTLLSKTESFAKEPAQIITKTIEIKNSLNKKTVAKLETAQITSEIDNKSLIQETKKPAKLEIQEITEKIPEFFLEQSEAIIETFKVEIPNQTDPNQDIIDELLVNKKQEPTVKPQTALNVNNFKIIHRQIQPSMQKGINLTEARKRKIIM